MTLIPGWTWIFHAPGVQVKRGDGAKSVKRRIGSIGGRSIDVRAQADGLTIFIDVPEIVVEGPDLLQEENDVID